MFEPSVATGDYLHLQASVGLAAPEAVVDFARKKISALRCGTQALRARLLEASSPKETMAPAGRT
jgi:hypothetical protein